MSGWSHAARRGAGFSLLELVAAMTILVVVIGVLSRIVTDTQRVWRQGADAATLTLNARAALALLDEDLASAVCSSNLLFLLRADAGEGPGPTELFFHRLQPGSAPGVFRALRQVHVFTATNTAGLWAIRRTSRPVPWGLAVDDPDNSLWSDDWLATIATNPAAPLLLDHVTALAITALYPEEAPAPPALPTGGIARSASYDSRELRDALPLALDLEVAALPERAARRHALLPDQQREVFREQHAVRFAHRVYFQNREGGLLP